MLPGFDGLEVCHRLRSEPDMAKLPILMLSAKQQKSDQDAASKVGANAFLPKPVDRTALLSKVAEFIGDRKDPNTI
jgi:two-component system cell cycle response regulator